VEEFDFEGRTHKKEKLIFPRFHQLDAVHKITAHAQNHGAGHNYLVQHSAGSGKSNSIA
jgi:type I restriction enzyme R subunit